VNVVGYSGLLMAFVMIKGSGFRLRCSGTGIYGLKMKCHAH